MTDLVVRGGTVVGASGSIVADVAVRHGQISAVGPGLPVNGVRTIDASGLLVLPGVVDVHTHTRLATDAEPDRFFQDSVAAAFGGTTTFLSFNNPGTGISEAGSRSLLAGLHEWRRRTDGDSAIDYGLSGVITAGQERVLHEIPRLVEAGVPTFKAFMVYDFGIGLDVIRAVMETARDAGGMLQLHCEDRGMLESAVAQLFGAGSTRPAHHADSRPPMVEAAGTECAVALARELRAPMYAVHVSCMAALEHVAAARRAGLPVYAETCPHFLALDASRYGSPDQEAIRYVISPPLRSPADRDALWQGLAEGSLDVVATDHVPDRLAVEKRYVGQPFTEISNGAPGIETLLSVVYSAGVASGRITLERMVDVVSTTPARLFGLAGKGAIEVGRDADVVLFDPSIRRTILAADLHHTSDYTPYEGMSVNGAIRTVLVRGRDVIRDGRFVGTRGFGRFQPRAIDWSQ